MVSRRFTATSSAGENNNGERRGVKAKASNELVFQGKGDR